MVKRGNKIISEAIWFLYVHYFSVTSCVEALNLIHMCVIFTNYSYPYIQCFAIESNSYALTVFLTEICFVKITFCPSHIYTLILWSIWNKGTFTIISYMVSTCIHLYLLFLTCPMWSRELKHMLITSVYYSHPV